MQQQIEETHASFDLRSHPQSKTIPEVYKAYRADISIQRPICQLYWCVCVCFMLLSMTSFVFSRRVRVDKLQQNTYISTVLACHRLLKRLDGQEKRMLLVKN